MSDAPDQIWIDSNGGNWSPCSGGTQDVEYRRADLPPTLPTVRQLPDVRALVAALQLAANRLDRCALDYNTGTRRFFETADWADEARAALAAIKEPKT